MKCKNKNDEQKINWMLRYGEFRLFMVRVHADTYYSQFIPSCTMDNRYIGMIAF